MNTFVDTSALMAVLDGDDQNHAPAKTVWERLVSDKAILTCTNYILVEALALIQNRLGISAVRAFQEEIVPLLRIEWMEAESHQRSVAALLTAGRRQLSLVDCASFETMRRLALGAVFTFDRHFAEQGFKCLPEA